MIWRRWIELSSLRKIQYSAVAVFVVIFVIPWLASIAAGLSNPHVADQRSGGASPAISGNISDISSPESQNTSQIRSSQAEELANQARAAGYNDATAEKIGRDAAFLCNGDRDCLR